MVDRPTQPTDESAPPAGHVEEEDAFDKLITQEARVLVDFHADWCGPCQMMSPMVDELAAESDTAIVKVDVETHPQLATRYDVSGIPTFIVFNDGSVEERLVGMQEKATLAKAIE